MLEQFLPPGANIGEVTAVLGSTVAPWWAWASDFLIVIIPTVVMILVVQYMGRGPYVSIIGGLYIGSSLYLAFPYVKMLPTEPSWMDFGVKAALFFAFFLAGYLILRRVAASDFLHIGLIGILVVSVATTGLIVAILYHVLPTREIYTFSPAIDMLFAPKEFFFAWFIAPLAGLFFLTR